MSASHDLQPIPLSDDPFLRVALAGHLARYTGRSRMHAESDLHIYLRWCAERDIHPLTARRVDVERHLPNFTYGKRLSGLRRLGDDACTT
jgi:integrase/recombinase XerD